MSDTPFDIFPNDILKIICSFLNLNSLINFVDAYGNKYTICNELLYKRRIDIKWKILGYIPIIRNHQWHYKIDLSLFSSDNPQILMQSDILLNPSKYRFKWKINSENINKAVIYSMTNINDDPISADELSKEIIFIANYPLLFVRKEYTEQYKLIHDIMNVIKYVNKK